MTSMLPPTRDLPPGRHARIRDEVERAVTGRRRRLLVPVLAGATAVAAVTTSIVLLPPEPSDPVPAVQITSAPPTTDFGVAPAEVTAIEEGCSRSAGSGEAKLRQLLDGPTRWALLYSDNAALVCGIGLRGLDHNSGFGQTSVRWLPGHFSLDYRGGSAGGDLDGRPASAGVPGTRTAVGRIDAKVARVTYTADGQTVEAKIANGTYAARIHYPSNWTIPIEPVPEEVRFYDAAGALLGTDADLGKCYYEPPTLRIVYGELGENREDCSPATPWK